jgi:hypothetical protein
VKSIEQDTVERISARGGVENLTCNDQDIIAEHLTAIYGAEDITHCGESEFGIPSMQDDEKEEIAHTIATMYLKAQGYDVSDEMTYDDIVDTLGLNVENVYQDVFCAIVYEIAEMRVRL